MPGIRRTAHRRRTSTSVIRNVLSQLAALTPVFPMECSMSNARRNLIIRTVGTLCADIAVGVAVAGAVGWIIQSASLGLFLTFLLWVLGIIVALALSQYLVHPISKVLLSDQKLDLAFTALGGLSGEAARFGLALMARMRTAS